MRSVTPARVAALMHERHEEEAQGGEGLRARGGEGARTPR
jgi:hypothetical protein